MRITLAEREKQALLAVFLCMTTYIILPFILVRFFPSAADFLKHYSLVTVMLPGIFIFAVLSLYSGSFFLKKDDFCDVPYRKISMWSLMMIVVNAIGTFLWTEFLKLMRLQFDTHVPVEDFIKSCTGWELVAAGIFICILTPVIEEVVFRRVIFEGLRERCPLVCSIVLASMLFGALHGILFQLFSLVLLGGYFQVLYCRENKLGSSIYAHFFNNTFAFIMLLVFKYYWGDIAVPR